MNEVRIAAIDYYKAWLGQMENRQLRREFTLERMCAHRGDDFAPAIARAIREILISRGAEVESLRT